MNKLNLDKPKNVSIKKLKAKSWKMFSLYIRTKYASPMGDIICYTCGKLGTIKTMQAGHGIAGRSNAVLFEEDIVRPQCAGCNIWGRGKYHIFTIKLVNELGMEKFKQIVNASGIPIKYTAQDYRDIYEKYKKKLSDISR